MQEYNESVEAKHGDRYLKSVTMCLYCLVPWVPFAMFLGNSNKTIKVTEFQSFLFPVYIFLPKRVKYGDIDSLDLTV